MKIQPTQINFEKSLFRKLTSLCFAISKFLALPEVIIWAIICSINYKTHPPKRIWYSIRMFNFISGTFISKTLIQLSFIIHHLTRSKLLSASSNVINCYGNSSFHDNYIKFENVENVETTLNSQGFAYLGQLSSEFLKCVSESFDSLCYFEDVEPQYHFQEGPDSRKKTGRFFADPSILSKNCVFESLYKHPVLIDLLHKHFKIQPLFYQINAWKSVPIDSDNPQKLEIINSINSRFPHIDYAALKFLKLFIFLDPVFDTDGPFHFWPGSFQHNCRYTYDGRYGYDEISDIFGPPITFTSSNPGSIFIADTSMYHCDGIVKDSGYRRVLQYEFCLPFIRLPDKKRLSILI